MTLKALIFDVDGTLAETEEAHRAAFNATFEEVGLAWHWSRKDYTWLLKTTGGKERMKTYREEISAEAPTDAEIAILHKRKTEIYGEILAQGGLTARDGIDALMAQARQAGLKLAVATTTNRPNVDALSQCLWGKPADKVFDVIAAGDEVTHKKPAPDVFLLAVERLGLPADDCLAFEDSRNGILSAKAAGLSVVVTPSVYTQGEDMSEADLLVDEGLGTGFSLERVGLPAAEPLSQ